MKKSILLVLLVLVASSAFGLKRRNAPQLPSDIKALHKILGKDCDANLANQFTISDIAPDVKLYLVQCYLGAYQGPSLGYIKQPNAALQQVSILTKTDSGSITSTTDLVNAAYDSNTKILSTASKGRGLGDCGGSSETKVEMTDLGISIVTKEIRFKEACDGEYEEWPVVFQQ